MELKQLLPSFERDDQQALAKQVEKHGLGSLKPLTPVKTWLDEAMAAHETAGDILEWLDGNAATGVAKSPDFVHMLSFAPQCSFF